MPTVRSWIQQLQESVALLREEKDRETYQVNESALRCHVNEQSVQGPPWPGWHWIRSTFSCRGWLECESVLAAFNRAYATHAWLSKASLSVQQQYAAELGNSRALLFLLNRALLSEVRVVESKDLLCQEQHEPSDGDGDDDVPRAAVVPAKAPSIVLALPNVEDNDDATDHIMGLNHDATHLDTTTQPGK